MRVRRVFSFIFTSVCGHHHQHSGLTRHRSASSPAPLPEKKKKKKMTAPTYIGAELEDGGADLAIPGGFVSTLHDGVYVAAAALVLGTFSSAGLALLGAFPAYGLAKLWSAVVAPFFFTARPAEVEAEAKSRAASEKRARKAAKRR
jgi:hypothetical protein